MKSIIFANGKEFEIIEIYNNGKRNIAGATRVCREIVVDADVITADELESLLSDKAKLETIKVTMCEDREVDGKIQHYEDTELLEGYVYADNCSFNFNGTRRFVIGKRTETEMEKDAAIAAVDELLMAMEV